MSSVKVAIVIGPFRAPTPWQVECNIRQAEECALELWRAGYAVICPHTNTRFFDKELPDDLFLIGIRELVRRADLAVPYCSDWHHSEGTRAEVELCNDIGIPVLTKSEAIEMQGSTQ